MHELLEPLSALVGTWRGDGVVTYPTIANDTPYRDEVKFADVGKPFLTYSQRTWAADGRLMHVETGYLRAVGDDAVELVVAIPTGQAEIGLGEAHAHDGELYFSVDGVVRTTPTAKRVDRIVRSFAVKGDSLSYDMAMEAVGVGLTQHLHSELTRSVSDF